MTALLIALNHKNLNFDKTVSFSRYTFKTKWSSNFVNFKGECSRPVVYILESSFRPVFNNLIKCSKGERNNIKLDMIQIYMI